MGIFDRVFGKKDQTEKKSEQLPWIPLDSLDQLDKIGEDSKGRTQAIFKHSSTCGISRVVLKMFKDSFDPKWDCDFYFLTIQTHRDISNEIEDRFRVRHESPQLLIIKNGEVTFHTSHGGIADTDLSKHL
ncbi:MAG: bacillithiol system redox-active protein YtxJ [Muricauda sp.]|nr:bacillithiol system redox-active protein YtxJ [Allomuricauda sp.]